MKTIPETGRRALANTPAEDTRIDAGIAQDPDSPELGDEFFKDARPAAEVLGADVMAQLAAKRSRGRPVGSTAESRKVPLNMRVDPEVLDAMRESGSGWQTRVNDLLRREFMRAK